MKHYIYNGVTYDKMPDPLNTENGQISPMYNSDGTPNEAKFIALGGVVTEDGKLTNFEICCEKFMQAVLAIQAFIHDPDFWGGFDEMHKLEESPYALADPVTANTLANKWNGANLAATYEGKKIGLGQPAWYVKCIEEWKKKHLITQVEEQEENPYES